MLALATMIRWRRWGGSVVAVWMLVAAQGCVGRAVELFTDGNTTTGDGPQTSQRDSAMNPVSDQVARARDSAPDRSRPPKMWAQLLASSGSSKGSGVAAYSSGGCLVAGTFTDKAAFGATTLSPKRSGRWDLFMARMDSKGKWLWAVTGGDAYYDYWPRVAVDGAGNGLVVGIFTGNAKFGATTLKGTGIGHLYVARLDSKGTWTWAASATSSYGFYRPNIAVDRQGNAYVTGRFSGSVAFGTTKLSTSSRGAFVAKLDGKGKWLWAVSNAGQGDATGQGIAADGQGGAFVTGDFDEMVSFGATTLSARGYLGTDMFVARVDSKAKWQWATSAGSSATAEKTEGRGIGADSSGGCVVTGNFKDTVSFGSAKLTAGGWEDAFVARLTGKGKWLWATSATNSGSVSGLDLAIDGAGHIHLTGLFNSWTKFGQTTLKQKDQYDVFMARLTSAGKWTGAYSGGSTGADAGLAISVDAAGRRYMTGIVGSPATFGANTLVSQAGYGAYFWSVE